MATVEYFERTLEQQCKQRSASYLLQSHATSKLTVKTLGFKAKDQARIPERSLVQKKKKKSHFIKAQVQDPWAEIPHRGHEEWHLYTLKLGGG